MPYDLLEYVCPPDGRSYCLLGIGTENCQCVQADDGWIEFRKNKHMEEFYVTNKVIGRGADTSDISNDGVHPTQQFYIQYTRKPQGKLAYGAPWAKRFMSINETFQRDCHVIRYHANGQIITEYDEVSTLIVKAHHYNFMFPLSGVTINDVLELQWGGQEVYYYGKDYGLVGWSNPITGQSSYVGSLNAVISDPFPHVFPRPPVNPPSIPAIPKPKVFAKGTNPQQMEVNLRDGIWLLGNPSLGSQHIRVLPYREVVTVFGAPVEAANNYNWQRVTTSQNEDGWSAVVDNTPSFVVVGQAVPAINLMAAATVNYPAGTNPQRMQVNLSNGIWLHIDPGLNTAHIRLLPAGEAVTLFADPSINADNYDWQRVTTDAGEHGWTAVVVAGTASFTAVGVPPPAAQPGAFHLSYPVAPPVRVSQPFGVNQTGDPTFYTQYGLPAHEGIDFGGEMGDPILAAANGKVLAINIPGQGGVPLDHAYGKHIKVKHSVGLQGYETDYCHLSGIAVGLTIGDDVTVGQTIGAMGNTGHVVAGQVHLHFMLRKAGATMRQEKQNPPPGPNGTGETYKNDIVNPLSYL